MSLTPQAAQLLTADAVIEKDASIARSRAIDCQQEVNDREPYGGDPVGNFEQMQILHLLRWCLFVGGHRTNIVSN